MGDCYLLSSLPLFQPPPSPAHARHTPHAPRGDGGGDVLSVDPGAVPVVLNTSRVLGSLPTFAHAPSMLHQVLRISSTVRSAATQAAERRAEAARKAVEDETRRAKKGRKGGRGVVSLSPSRARRSKRSRRGQSAGGNDAARELAGTPVPPPPGMLWPLEASARRRLRRAADVYDATVLVFAKLGRRWVVERHGAAAVGSVQSVGSCSPWVRLPPLHRCAASTRHTY